MPLFTSCKKWKLNQISKVKKILKRKSGFNFYMMKEILKVKRRYKIKKDCQFRNKKYNIKIVLILGYFCLIL